MTGTRALIVLHFLKVPEEATFPSPASLHGRGAHLVCRSLLGALFSLSAGCCQRRIVGSFVLAGCSMQGAVEGTRLGTDQGWRLEGSGSGPSGFWLVEFQVISSGMCALLVARLHVSAGIRTRT